MPQLSPEYLAYIQSRAWLDRRAAALRDPNAACWCCGVMAGVQPLDLHHLTYERLRHEWPKDLVLLCRTCHDTVHARRSKHGSIMAATRYVREMQAEARQRQRKPFAPSEPIESRPDTRAQVVPIVPPPVRWVGGTLSKSDYAAIRERNKRIQNGRTPPPIDPKRTIPDHKWTQGKYKGRPKGERKNTRNISEINQNQVNQSNS